MLTECLNWVKKKDDRWRVSGATLPPPESPAPSSTSSACRGLPHSSLPACEYSCRGDERCVTLLTPPSRRSVLLFAAFWLAHSPAHLSRSWSSAARRGRRHTCRRPFRSGWGRRGRQGQAKTAGRRCVHGGVPARSRVTPVEPLHLHAAVVWACRSLWLHCTSTAMSLWQVNIFCTQVKVQILV